MFAKRLDIIFGEAARLNQDLTLATRLAPATDAIHINTKLARSIKQRTSLINATLTTGGLEDDEMCCLRDHDVANA